jgi:hypothetical protein
MVLEATAFSKDGTEDAAEAGSIERAGVALDNRVEDGGLAGFIGDRQAVLALEAGDFRYGLGSAVDETEEFEIEFVDGSALLSKGLGHGVSLLFDSKNTKAAIWDRGRLLNCVRSLES